MPTPASERLVALLPQISRHFIEARGQRHNTSPAENLERMNRFVALLDTDPGLSREAMNRLFHDSEMPPAFGTGSASGAPRTDPRRPTVNFGDFVDYAEDACGLNHLDALRYLPQKAALRCMTEPVFTHPQTTWNLLAKLREADAGQACEAANALVQHQAGAAFFLDPVPAQALEAGARESGTSDLLIGVDQIGLALKDHPQRFAWFLQLHDTTIMRLFLASTPQSRRQYAETIARLNQTLAAEGDAPATPEPPAASTRVRFSPYVSVRAGRDVSLNEAFWLGLRESGRQNDAAMKPERLAELKATIGASFVQARSEVPLAMGAPQARFTSLVETLAEDPILSRTAMLELYAESKARQRSGYPSGYPLPSTHHLHKSDFLDYAQSASQWSSPEPVAYLPPAFVKEAIGPLGLNHPERRWDFFEKFIDGQFPQAHRLARGMLDRRQHASTRHFINPYQLFAPPQSTRLRGVQLLERALGGHPELLQTLFHAHGAYIDQLNVNSIPEEQDWLQEIRAEIHAHDAPRSAEAAGQSHTAGGDPPLKSRRVEEPPQATHHAITLAAGAGHGHHYSDILERNNNAVHAARSAAPHGAAAALEPPSPTP